MIQISYSVPSTFISNMHEGFVTMFSVLFIPATSLTFPTPLWDASDHCWKGNLLYCNNLNFKSIRSGTPPADKRVDMYSPCASGAGRRDRHNWRLLHPACLQTDLVVHFVYFPFPTIYNHLSSICKSATLVLYLEIQAIAINHTAQ